ncbi:hypothetical protein NFI95_15685 [Acetobacteraceae bacterium KSS8]|uniref:Uncharacterized protein n=1 Tax=Endosaccharibacter trunci TaxID=2812733 RepID=A0ABT1WCP7_9PROT|nr:hypothetical protein [Acetobacteraceae bacterium KSS8]
MSALVWHRIATFRGGVIRAVPRAIMTTDQALSTPGVQMRMWRGWVEVMLPVVAS